MHVKRDDYIFAIVEGDTYLHSDLLRRHGIWHARSKVWLLAAADDADLARLRELGLIAQAIRPHRMHEVDGLLTHCGLPAALDQHLQTESQRRERQSRQAEYDLIRRAAAAAQQRRLEQMRQSESEESQAQYKKQKAFLEFRNASFGQLEVACPFCTARSVSDLLRLDVDPCDHLLEVTSRRKPYAKTRRHALLDEIPRKPQRYIDMCIQSLMEQGVPPNDADELGIVKCAKEDVSMVGLYARDACGWIRMCVSQFAARS